MIDRSQLDAAQFVQDILTRWPWTAQVFVNLRTACVGCQMARFCTLDDVTLHYGLDREPLIQALLQTPSPAADTQ
jgi:hybrid cluster-associated redox disulfide protein